MGISGFAALTAEEWTALGTVATAVVAVLAAGFAALQVWELRRTREDQTRPFDARGREQPNQQYTIDMGYMYGTTQIREYGLHDAAKAISEIQKSVKKWSDIHGRLKVWVRDEDRHRREERIEYDLTGAHPTLGRRSPSELTLALGRNVVVRSAVRRIREWRDSRRTGSE